MFVSHLEITIMLHLPKQKTLIYMFVYIYKIHIYVFDFFPSCDSPVPVAGNSHVSPKGQMGFFLLFPALLCFLHPNTGKCEAAAGAEPAEVFR